VVRCFAWLRTLAVRTKAVFTPHPPSVREEEISTRKRLHPWDRVKFLLLFTVVWFVLVWSVMASDPIVGFRDAMAIEVRTGWWVFILAGLELIRQVHFLFSENWAGYHRFWKHTFFGGVERTSQRNLSDWTRFRFRRVITWALLIVVVALAAGKIQHNNPLIAAIKLPYDLWHALPVIFYILAILLLTISQFALLFWFLSRGGIDIYYPDDIKTRFSDVWGQDHVLERVKENILYLENPEIIESRGGYVPGGILLHGPPGTGKTLMAEAVAGETGKPYVFVDPGAFINMFMGVGILKVKSLFRKLRKLTLRYGGVIVFFDEADSLGSRGAIAQGGQFRASPAAPWDAHGCNGFTYLSQDVQWRLASKALSSSGGEEPDGRRLKQIMGMGMNGGGGMGTLQALLTELSGLKKPRGFMNRVVRRTLGMRPKPPPKYRILVMMASNMPESLDDALLRPGRIDRIYKVGYPSKPGRVRTYEGYLAKVRHELSAEQIDKLAVITPYATGATIKDLVNEALIQAIRNDRDVITWPDVIKAKQLKELGPPEDVDYIERERHAVAIHEACHAVVAYRTRRHLEIDIATIEKGKDYLGMVASIPPEDQFNQWRTEYESDILCALASLAGEKLFFDDDSSRGVHGDLEAATTMASFMEGFWGMGSTVSSYSTALRMQVGAPGGTQGGRNKKGQDPEQELRHKLADRIEDNLNVLLVRVRQILRENRVHVLCLAHALEVHKTLTGDDVIAVIERHQGPIIDGTPYADPDFLRQLEDYHNGALEAHRGHSNLVLQIPEIEQPELVAAPVAVGFLVGRQEEPAGHDPENGAAPAGQNGLADQPGLPDGLALGPGAAAPQQGNGSWEHDGFGPAGQPVQDALAEPAAEPGADGAAGPDAQPEPGSDS
jgi:ATP-dependent Zn protease